MSTPTPEFSPDEFDAKKYDEYFPQLQHAYKRAFQDVNDTYDSELVHAIDQHVFNESEPKYEGGTDFHIELPDDPHDRIAAAGVLAGDDRIQAVLDAYVDALETALLETFTSDTDEPKA